jgi:hypothetical protein
VGPNFFTLKNPAASAGFEPSQQVLPTHLKLSNLSSYSQSYRGRDSSVGIATRYGLDCSVIESPWEARFSAPVLWTTRPAIQWATGLSRE